MTIDTQEAQGGALLLRGGHRHRRDGRAALRGRRAHRRRSHRRRSALPCRPPTPTVIDATGLIVAPGLHRRPHARRPDRARGASDAAQDQPGRHHGRRRQLRHQPRAARARRTCRRRSTCSAAATSTFIRRWPRTSRRWTRRALPSTSPRWSATRRCASRRWTIPIAPRRPPSRRSMVDLLREALGAGAIGLSSGVFYATGAAADVDELSLLAARRRRSRRRLYDAYPRRDGPGPRFARRGIRHRAARQAAGRHLASQVRGAATTGAGPCRRWRTSTRRGKRSRSGSTAYPYIAGSTVLRSDLVDGIIDIIVTWSEPHPEMAARHLADIAAEWGCTQQEACERLQPGGACYFQMREDDVQRVLALPGDDDRLRRPAARPAIRIRACGAPSRACSATTAATSASFRSRPPCTR